MPARTAIAKAYFDHKNNVSIRGRGDGGVTFVSVKPGDSGEPTL